MFRCLDLLQLQQIFYQFEFVVAGEGLSTETSKAKFVFEVFVLY